MPSPGLVSFCDQEQHCTATETIARARVADPRLGARDGDSIGAVGPVARIRDAIPAPAAARRRQCEAHVTRPAVECHVYLGRGITELAAVDFPSDGVVVLIVPIVGIGSRAGGGDPLQLCHPVAIVVERRIPRVRPKCRMRAAEGEHAFYKPGEVRLLCIEAVAQPVPRRIEIVRIVVAVERSEVLVAAGDHRRPGREHQQGEAR